MLAAGLKLATSSTKPFRLEMCRAKPCVTPRLNWLLTFSNTDAILRASYPHVMNRTMTHFFVKQVKQVKKPDDMSG
jgi:hypothetical protein